MVKNYFLKRLTLMFILIMGSSQLNAQLYSFTTHTFTNAGAAGRLGPVLADCQAAYSATTWASNTAFFNMSTQGIQEWTVPQTGMYSIEAFGGEGGTGFYEHGQGAQMYGEFSLTQGEIIYILVGQQGEDHANQGGGGGGGTFIWDSGLNLLIAAGGGGGASDNQSVSTVSPYIDGQATELITYNATAGSGGPQGTSGSWYGGGGGGWTSNGTPIPSTYGEGGMSPANGGLGGNTWNLNAGYADGGFGGGGGSGYDAGGGGGGYTGGNGGTYATMQEHAGGGGSFNSGINQVNQTGTNLNDGMVIITVLCSPLTTTVSGTNVCFGDMVTLSATGTGTITWDNGVSNGVPFASPIGTTTYTATSSDMGECPFSVDITTNALPTVTGTVNDSVICLGDSIILYGMGADTYAWDNGAMDSVYFVPSTGGSTNYTLIGTDLNGCAGTDIVNVFVSELALTAVITNENLGGDGAIDLSVTGGTGSYNYSWDSGPTTEDITSLASGTYTVSVDDGACSQDSTFTILNVAGVLDFENSSLEVYPNPTTGLITINFNGTYDFQILNILGELIVDRQANNSTKVDLSEYNNGIYFVRIFVEGNQKTIKVVKQ